MKKYYLIEPEVSGNIANSDFIDRNSRPPEINSLVFEFDGWLGDDIVESIMTYTITKGLKNELEKSALSGYVIKEMSIRKSDLFKELYPKKMLPDFYWFEPNGIKGEDDFCRSEDGDLIISHDALVFLKMFTIDHADIELDD